MTSESNLNGWSSFNDTSTINKIAKYVRHARRVIVIVIVMAIATAMVAAATAALELPTAIEMATAMLKAATALVVIRTAVIAVRTTQSEPFASVLATELRAQATLHADRFASAAM
jgi:hypothetical protein